MLAYRKERIDNAILFFAEEHHKKTKTYLSQTALYKYLAFFEFRYLKKYGDMPLELEYRAMERGPVPIEIYNNRDNSDFFSLVSFNKIKNGFVYQVIPNGRFEPDYFSENELDEMKSLIEIFARSWITAKIMSDASHNDIKAWSKTYKNKHNDIINPIFEFENDITQSDDLTSAEERYLIHKNVLELVD
jgi:hypothetical protein